MSIQIVFSRKYEISRVDFLIFLFLRPNDHLNNFVLTFETCWNSSRWLRMCLISFNIFKAFLQAKMRLLCSKSWVYKPWIGLSFDLMHKWTYLCKCIAYECIFMSLDYIIDIWSFCDIKYMFREYAHDVWKYALNVWNLQFSKFDVLA